MPKAPEPTLFRPAQKLCYACDAGLTGKVKKCYACENYLTGELKRDGTEWECSCDEWECRCWDEPDTQAYCPICGEWFWASNHLRTVFGDDLPTLWLANMVTHYRHGHREWDRSHPYISSKYGQATYERQKARINEQAKRQIIRKVTDFLISNGVTIECFRKLQGTEEKTLELAKKKLK